MTLENILFILTGTSIALIAGLFFGFSVAVNGGLHTLKNIEYVRAIQSINRYILNPVFLLTFMAPLLLLPVVSYEARDKGIEFGLLMSASFLYIVCTFGLTMFGNVPLNNKLDKFKTQKATEKEIAAIREKFEQPWNRLHMIRTIASLLATMLFFTACLLQ